MAPQIYNTAEFLCTTSWTHGQPSKLVENADVDVLICEADVYEVVRDYLELYSSPDYDYIHPTNEKLEAVMRAELKARHICSRRLENMIHLAASLIELAFNRCTLEEKKTIALFNLYIIYIDDAVLKDARPCTLFQSRFVQGLPQLDPVLDAFADVLHTLSETYPPLQANLILSSAFEFVSASCIEPQLALARGIPSSKASRTSDMAATRFPLFLRERTGLGLPGALMLFSPSQPTDFVDLFKALGDMTFWTAAVNDLLSFFKEELAGETSTYIHTRATAEGRSPFTVLASLKDELCTASRNITRILAGDPTAAEAWRMFEHGVVVVCLLQASEGIIVSPSFEMTVQNGSRSSAPQLNVTIARSEIDLEQIALTGVQNSLLSEDAQKPISISPPQQQNMMAPVFRLPEDIFRLIFKAIHDEHVLDVKYENFSVFKACVAISQVCSAWRRIALDYPALWTVIFDKYHLRRIEEMVARAQEAPLHVALSLDQSFPGNSIREEERTR
ncbi:hypothetical protein H0H87_007731 [Tephrocybe sp. NHM501043]|nr:hypothetical protein H0H87_007731 [Tephrocybe sp. NHM501043]